VVCTAHLVIQQSFLPAQATSAPPSTVSENTVVTSSYAPTVVNGAFDWTGNHDTGCEDDIDRNNSAVVDQVVR